MPSARSGTDRPRRNWAGNHVYRYADWHEPRSVEQLAQVVEQATSVRALGSRHCFHDIADPGPGGSLVDVRGLPVEVDVDAARRVARVSATATYAEVAPRLHALGWALPNLASLPHITVGGAIATGTHGSGVANQSLGGPVRGIEYVDAAGDLRRVDSADPELPGHVTSLGALGVWTHIELAVEPSFEMVQTVRLGLPWDAVLADLDALLAAAYSVSLFSDFAGDTVDQMWLKARADDEPPRVDLGRPAATAVHMLTSADPAAVSLQLGVPGPWHERLPHFRPDFTPSRGAEIQSEYLLPFPRAAEAIERLRAVAPLLGEVMQCAEVRTIAADDHWLGLTQGGDAVAFHFTWVLDPMAVREAVAAVEDALLPLGARPHWGKVFLAEAAELAPRYPRLGDFRALRARLDPDGVFDNAFLRRVLG